MTLDRRALIVSGLALAASASAARAAPLPPVPGEMVMGSPKAPVQLVVYASASCPHCAHWWTTVLPEVRKAFIDTGKVRLVFREFLTPPEAFAAAGFILARRIPGKYFEVLTTTGTGSVIVEGTDGGDEFNNQGTFEGNIGLGGGDDNFSQTGTVNGDVDLGEGDDAINNTGTINGTVDLGTGNNAFVNAPSATINGNVQASTGDDQIDNQGTVNGNVDLGDGNNQFASFR